MDKFFRPGEFIEYTCQWFSPVILFFLLRGNTSYPQLSLLMRIAVALTFTGHALYAIGYYPIPGNFIDMIIMSFGVSQKTAIVILGVVGWLDLVVAVLILLPYTYRYAALYAFVWGSLTALARIYANFDIDLTAESLYQWMPEVLVRVPNALIPLAVFIMPARNSEIQQV